MEEQEIYDLFKKRLHRNLKTKINGNVFVTIENDTLYVRMTKLGVYWEITYPCILTQILEERETNKIEHDILKDFRKMVHTTFFY